MTWLNRILLALLVTGGLAFLPNYQELGSEDLGRVRAEREELLDGNRELREEIRLIEAEVASLRPDPEDPHSSDRVDRELARVAREDLNMIEPGELVFEVRRPQAGTGR